MLLTLLTALALSGELEHPQTLALDQLRHLPVVTPAPVEVRSARGDVHGLPRHFRGARLRDVLALAAVKDARPHTLYVLATGTDGYQVLYSWREVLDTPTGDELIVVYEEDGKPLNAHDGELLLVSPADRHSGPRMVRNLARLEVRRAP